MNDLAKFQTLINDGFNLHDYLDDKQKFQNCGACCDPFSLLVLPPALMECGHFMCQLCWVRCKSRCPYCDKPKKIRQKNYPKLINLETAIRNQQLGKISLNTYKFAVKLNDSKVFTTPEISGTLNFRQIFTTIPEFQMYEKALKGNIILHINSIGIIFEQIQKLPINKYNQFLRVQKKKTTGALVTAQVRANMITFSKRFDGGYIC